MKARDIEIPPVFIPFLKMHGLGNDFVILDARGKEADSVFAHKADLSQKLGDRHFGVGCDQIIFLETSQAADVFMRIYNPDGSEAGACGNATRCVADLILTERKALSCTIETRSRTLACTRTDDGLIAVVMGAPKLAWQDIPLASPCDTLYVLPSEQGGGVAVNMGNPHCVFFVEDLDAVDIATHGPRMETDAIFPDRANIEYVQVINRTHIRMRVWERGAGVTLACGSGACAAAVAAIRRGLTDRRMVVSMPGGDLILSWETDTDPVVMTGPVAYVFRGEWGAAFSWGGASLSTDNKDY